MPCAWPTALVIWFSTWLAAPAAICPSCVAAPKACCAACETAPNAWLARFANTGKPGNCGIPGAPPPPPLPDPDSPIITVNSPNMIMPPWAVGSSILAAGSPPISTVGEPMAITSGGPTHVNKSVTRAAGSPPIST